MNETVLNRALPLMILGVFAVLLPVWLYAVGTRTAGLQSMAVQMPSAVQCPEGMRPVLKCPLLQLQPPVAPQVRSGMTAVQRSTVLENYRQAMVNYQQQMKALRRLCKWECVVMPTPVVSVPAWPSITRVPTWRGYP